MRLFLILIALLASPAFAQERGPGERQILVDLAYVIGEAHALRQTCNGEGDQFWRNRMMTLLDAENADLPFTERLRSAFNGGFLARRQMHPVCLPETRAAEDQVSAKGQDLARRLAARPTQR